MRLNSIKEIEILRLTKKGKVKGKDKVIKEIPLTIFANNVEVGALFYTPPGADYLAVGFLLSQGIIENREKIKGVYFNPEKNFTQVKLDLSVENVKTLSSSKNLYLSSCGACSFSMPGFSNNLKRIDSCFKIKKEALFKVMEEFEKKSHLFKTTGGNHSCGLYNGESFEVFAEDIGRHNAVDKIVGKCYLREIKTEDKLLLVSGRVSWEILTKTAGAAIPILASPSAPTDLAISLAHRLNITLVGFLRKKRMNIYTHPRRVV